MKHKRSSFSFLPSSINYPTWIFLIILACVIVTGGSSREWGLLKIYISLGAALSLIWSVNITTVVSEKMFKFIIGLFLIVACLIAVQLYPLPFTVWKTLPDREPIVSAMSVLNVSELKMPISLYPEKTRLGFIAFFPPLAVISALLGFKYKLSTQLLVWLLPTLAVLSVFIGYLQLASGGKGALYIYKVTNIGSPVGIFSNVNHQATFLLMSLPFLAVIIARKKSQLQFVTAIFMALFIVSGVLATKSGAGYGLLIIVFLACSILIKPRRRRRKSRAVIRWMPVTLATSIVLCVFSYWVFQNVDQNLEILNVGAPTSRITILKTALPIFKEHFLWGTGLGSFADVYRLYEDSQAVIATYVNHAHNDYLEWIVETGIIGFSILGLFMLWLAKAMIKTWSLPKGENNKSIRNAASIAVLVVVLHSLVDYPLRTPALSLASAMCLGLMFLKTPSRANTKTSPNKNLEL